MIESEKIGQIIVPMCSSDDKYMKDCYTELRSNVYRWLIENDIKFSLPIRDLPFHSGALPLIEFDNPADEVHFKMIWL